MSSPYAPILFSAAALLILWLLCLLLLRFLNKQWWSLRGVRTARRAAPLIGLGAVALWALGTALDLRWPVVFGSGVAASELTLFVAVAAALPLSGVVLLIERLVRAIRARGKAAEAPVVGLAETPVNSSRRSFVVKAAGVLPAATIATAGYGLISSHGSVRMPEIPLTFSTLPPGLEGYRILHISDVHLGYYVDLHDLETLVESASALRPDLVIVSGDIADDLRMLPDALRILSTLKPNGGIFATLGNHEYFHGIQDVLRAMDAGPIPLLRNTGAAVAAGGTTIYVGGADDPVSMSQRERNHRFLQNSVAGAFDGAPSDAFHLLVSHRPEGFDVAREQGISLTIAGHTHGGQLGFNGRSMLEPFYPERYLWGHYRRGEQQLYTSAGVGHWFPFRLGCPPEAPLYVLRKG